MNNTVYASTVAPHYTLTQTLSHININAHINDTHEIRRNEKLRTIAHRPQIYDSLNVLQKTNGTQLIE